MPKPTTINIDVRLPAELTAEVTSLAKLAGVAPSSVIKIAMAHELRRCAAINAAGIEPPHAPNARTAATRFAKQPDDTVLDTTTQLTWSRTLCEAGKPKRMTHEQAAKACAALGEGWRLPTRTELLTLVDDTRHSPAIDVEAFPDTQSNWYWTGTPAAWDPSSDAWIVGFGSGGASDGHRGGGAFVRAVRSSPSGQ